jgi:hypothetical protein
MKNIFSVFTILSVLTLACNTNTGNPKEPTNGPTGEEQLKIIAEDTASRTTIQWTDSLKNFGKVVEGEKVLIEFNFTNTGKNPLIIKEVTASCGCTVPEKPKEPIPPGKSGVIKAEFNTENRAGFASKDVIVTCNTASETYTLHFEGEVLKKK